MVESWNSIQIIKQLFNIANGAANSIENKKSREFFFGMTRKNARFAMKWIEKNAGKSMEKILWNEKKIYIYIYIYFDRDNKFYLSKKYAWPWNLWIKICCKYVYMCILCIYDKINKSILFVFIGTQSLVANRTIVNRRCSGTAQLVSHLVVHQYCYTYYHYYSMLPTIFFVAVVCCRVNLLCIRVHV